MVGRETRVRASLLQQAAELAVQGAARRPACVRVQRLPHEVVPEGGHAGPGFAEQAPVENLAQAGVAAELGEQLELDLHADHGGSLQGGMSLVRQPFGPDPERVSERVGDRHAGSLLQFEAMRPRPEPALPP